MDTSTCLRTGGAHQSCRWLPLVKLLPHVGARAVAMFASRGTHTPEDVFGCQSKAFALPPLHDFRPAQWIYQPN